MSLTSFVTTVLVGRLGEEQLGVYGLGVGTFWLALGIPKALVWTPYTARAAQLDERARDRLRARSTALLAALAAAAAVVIAACGAVVYAAAPGQAWLANLLFCMAPLAMAVTLREHVRRIAIADFRTPQLLLVDLPLCVGTIAAVALLGAQGWLTACTAILATAALAAATLPLVWRQFARTKPSLAGVAAEARSSWRFGRWLLLAAIALLVSDSSLRWMLTGMHGKAAMGLFMAAFSVVMLVNPLMLAMNTFARSWATRVYSRGHYPGLLLHTKKSTAVAAAAALVAAVLFWTLGGYAVALAFPKATSDPWLLRLLAIGICLQATLIPAEAALTAMQRGKQLSAASGARLATTLAVGVPLVYLQGPLGIAWAVIARSVPVVIMYWRSLLLTDERKQAPAEIQHSAGVSPAQATTLPAAPPAPQPGPPQPAPADCVGA
ncbi:MAG: hypothetical protein AAF790_10180 [Planctomycetota bacterium]